MKSQDAEFAKMMGMKEDFFENPEEVDAEIARLKAASEKDRENETPQDKADREAADLAEEKYIEEHDPEFNKENIRMAAEEERLKNAYDIN